MSMRWVEIGRDHGNINFGLQVRCITILLLLTLSVVSPAGVSAQDAFINREAEIKAAFIFQFIRYVHWPTDVFANAQSPLVIGVVGKDPVNEHLRLIVKKRTAGGRKLAYREVTAGDEARLCHIVFVSDGAGEKTTEAIVRSSQGVSVLLVGEDPKFVDAGGTISFIMVGNNVRLRLSMKKATDHELTISSQLAKLAEIVD